MAGIGGRAEGAAQADLAGRLALPHGECPREVRNMLGFALYQAQIGQQHESAKILRGFGEALWQVRADDPSGTYRAVYVVQFEEAIYVLHAFQKKAKSGIATPRRELDLIRQRLQLARKLAGK
jgi:phage-related protein